MNDAFDDRRRMAENKWAHDEELHFKIIARRDKLLGLWAAAELGLTEAEAENYARDIIRADVEEPGDEDVVRKLHSDFEARGMGRSDHSFRVKIGEMLALATDQIMHESRK